MDRPPLRSREPLTPLEPALRPAERRALGGFFGLAFGIAWGVPGLALALATLAGTPAPDLREFTPLSYVSLWAPAMAAVAVIAWQHGWAGVWTYARRVVRPTGAWGWYAAVVVGVVLVNLAAAAGMETLGRDAMAWPPGAWGALALLALLRLTEGPMEELGWRGFALPLLQRRFSGLGASVVLGLLWALWHGPAFVVGRSVGGGVAGSWPYVVGVFTLGLVALSVLFTVVYNATGGSVPAAVLFHWMTNLPYPWETGLDLALVATPLWIGLAVLVGLTVGRRHLRRPGLHTEVAPGVLPSSSSKRATVSP